MRSLASSTCLLFHIAIVAILGTDVILYCEQLVDDDNLIGQLKECDGGIIGYQSSEKHHFDLSKLSQEDANTVLYENQVPKGFRGHVTIEDSSLESLNLGFAKFAEPIRIVIIGNKNLTRLALDIKTPETKVKLTLRGNKQLSWGSIKMLKKIPQINLATSDIQEYHDCSFIDGKVKALDDLQGCSTVDGDLIINENTVIPSIMPSVRINTISNGCLRIENSKLTSIDFLEELLDGKSKQKCADGGQSHIKGNTELCIPSEDWPKWNAVYPLTYAGTCRDRCSLDFALANQDATKAPCDVVVGDVKITGNHRVRRQSGTPPDLAHWDRVKELEGTLEVSGTDLEDITIFNNLEKIANPSPEKVALTVIKNPKMTKFDLPKLKNITMPSNAWSAPVLFYDYGNFTFTSPEGKRWERITGRSHLMMPIEPTPVTIGPPALPGTTTLSPKQRENKEIEEHNASVKSSQDLIIVIVAVAGCLIVLGTGIFICCIMFCCSCKGRLSKEDKDLTTHLVPAAKNAETLKTAEKMEDTREELTVGAGGPEQFQLRDFAKLIVRLDGESVENRQHVTRTQMALDAEEIPFKLTDMITKFDAPELDLQRARELLTQAPLSTMKYTGKPFRYIEEYKILFLNPKELYCEPMPHMETYDRITVFKYLLTRCSDFFVTNCHLMPHIINDCKGPYYTPNGSLLVEIEGPVYVIGDIHEALHVLQTILNLDLDGEGNKHKIHPMFRNRYLFLGDYLDRGEHGLEVYFLLCIAAREFPDLFTVLRGNHDSWIPSHPYIDNGARMNKYGRRLVGKLPNPYAFADCMIIDLVRFVTPYLPVAAIVNGHTFAAHGGFTLAMATTKKSVREIFKEIPVPYYDLMRSNVELLARHYPNDKRAKPFPLELYKVNGEQDVYTVTFEKHRKFAKDWDAYMPVYLANRKANPNMEPDYNYETRFPGFNHIMWSDPGHGIASAGSQRGVGSTFTTEVVQRMMENNKATDTTKSIEEIIRAHVVIGISHSCDHRVTTIFTNCNNVQEVSSKPAELECKTDLMRCASILRINEDGSRTIILLGVTTEKKGNEALANPKRRIKRRIEKEKTLAEKEKEGKEKEKKEMDRKEKEKKEKEEMLKKLNEKKTPSKGSIEQKQPNTSKEKSSQSKNSTQKTA